MKKRSDRFVCRLRDYTLKTIVLIGDEAVGIPYAKKSDGGYNDCTFFPNIGRAELTASCQLSPRLGSDHCPKGAFLSYH
jgi:hypothetical protein